MDIVTRFDHLMREERELAERVRRAEKLNKHWPEFGDLPSQLRDLADAMDAMASARPCRRCGEPIGTHPFGEDWSGESPIFGIPALHCPRWYRDAPTSLPAYTIPAVK